LLSREGSHELDSVHIRRRRVRGAPGPAKLTVVSGDADPTGHVRKQHCWSLLACAAPAAPRDSPDRTSNTA